MSTSINNGGPAFPSVHKEIQGQFSHFGTREVEVWRDGMTLRDYFAAKTLPACIAVVAEALAAGRVTMTDEQAADLRRAICIDAWGWADEMLATRGTQS